MHRMLMSVLLVVLLLCIPRGAEIHAQALPPDFRLTATVGSVAPWEDRATVTLDHAGRISYIQFTTGENPFVMAESTFTVSVDDILPLWQVIQDSSFFTLKPRVVDSTIKDGVFARVLISANRVSHQVIVKNTAQPRLQAIIESLNELLPESMQLTYARPEILLPNPRHLHNSSSAFIDRRLQKDAARKGWRDAKSRAAPKREMSSASDGTTASHPGTVVAYQVPLDQAVAGGYASLSSKGEYWGDAVSISLDNSKPHPTDRISVIFYIDYYGDGATPENVDKIDADIMKTWNGHKTSDGKAVDVTVVPRVDVGEPVPSGDPNYHQIQLTTDPSQRSYVNVPNGTGANDGTMTGTWGVQDKGPGTWGHEGGHLGNLDDKYDDYNELPDGSWVNERTGQSIGNSDQLLSIVATKYSQETADKAKSSLDRAENCSVARDGYENDLMGNHTKPVSQSDIDRIAANPGLLVLVPHGSVLVNKHRASQNLVVIHEDQVFVKSGDQRTLNGIYASCIDEQKLAPEENVHFDLTPPLESWRGIAAASALAKVVRFIDSAGFYYFGDYYLHAIWRITDNSFSYPEESILAAAGVNLGAQVLDFPRLSAADTTDTASRQIVPDELFVANIHPSFVEGRVGSTSTVGAGMSMPSGVKAVTTLLWSATGPNGVPVAVTSTDSTVSLIPSASGVYQLNLRISVTDSARSQKTFDSGKKAYIIVPNNFTETFEHANLSDKFAWKTYGDAPWKITQTEAQTGHFAAQPGELIYDGQTSTLEIDLTLPADSVIGFSVRTATVDASDHLVFSIDSPEIERFSGLSDWQIRRYPLAKGKHVLTWTCSGDPVTIANQVWIDNVFLPGNAVATSVGTKQTLPLAFALEQNYPNPFNPSSTIRYELPKAANVSLRIYNTLGQLVASLVDEHKAAGSYQVQWNANVPSGIYFYRLQAGDASTGSARGFVETKKMILIR